MPSNSELASSQTLRLTYLDGLRGLAVLFVFFHHLWTLQFTVMDGVQGIAVNWINYGHLAVDVFIVLSGFCLALPVAYTGRLKGGSLTFFKRRARRILPPFYAAILVCLGLDFLIRHFGHSHLHNGSPFALDTVIANFLLLQDFWPGTNVINPAFWSVALEWKIYFLFPVIVWIWQKYKRPAVLSFGLLLGLILTFLLRRLVPGNSFQHACPWYLILFVSGVSASLGSVNISPSEWKKMSRAAYSVMLLSLVCTGVMLSLFPLQKSGSEAFEDWVPLTDSMFGVFVASLLVTAAHAPDTSFVRRFLSSKWLVFVGTISYSLYLIHFPVLVFAEGIVSHALGHHGSPWTLWLGTLVAGTPITLAASYVFHLLFERPFMSQPAPATERQAERAAIVSPSP